MTTTTTPLSDLEPQEKLKVLRQLLRETSQWTKQPFVDGKLRALHTSTWKCLGHDSHVSLDDMALLDPRFPDILQHLMVNNRVQLSGREMQTCYTYLKAKNLFVMPNTDFHGRPVVGEKIISAVHSFTLVENGAPPHVAMAMTVFELAKTASDTLFSIFEKEVYVDKSYATMSTYFPDWQQRHAIGKELGLSNDELARYVTGVRDQRTAALEADTTLPVFEF